jgi:hypothetical protein
MYVGIYVSRFPCLVVDCLHSVHTLTSHVRTRCMCLQPWRDVHSNLRVQSHDNHSTAAAMSIDYSLFLLRRFRDECKNWQLAGRSMAASDERHDSMETGGVGESSQGVRVANSVLVVSSDAEVEAMVDSAVFEMVRHAGHVVVMAGSTIVVVFLGYGILPANTLRMDGAACTLSVMLCMLINLTNTPALLFLFPRFFSTFTFNGSFAASATNATLSPDAATAHGGGGDRDGASATSMATAHYVALADEADTDTANATKTGATWTSSLSVMDTSATILDVRSGAGTRPFTSAAAAVVHPMYSGWRFKITKKVTSWPCNLVAIVVLYVSVIPLAWQIKHIDVNQNVLGVLGRHTPASARLIRMVGVRYVSYL